MEAPVPGRETRASFFYLPTTPTPDTPDPLGILKVNGIYGPGTWAGWFLTIFASWFAIFAPTRERSRKGIHHDLIMHIVFTNWAAIDLFRQLGFRQATKDDDVREGLGGAIAAAVTITFWGLHTTLWQLGVCVYFDKNSGTRSSSQAVWDLVSQYRRCIVLLVSTILPSIALVVFETYLPGLTDEGGGFANSVPALYLDGSYMAAHWAALEGAGGVGLWSITFSFLCLVLIALPYFDQRHRVPGLQRHDMDIPTILIVPAFLSFCLSAIISFFVSGTYLLLAHPIAIGIHIFFIVFFAFYAFIVVALQHGSVWRTILGVLLLPSVLLMLLSYCMFLGAPAIHIWWWFVDMVIRHGDDWAKNCFAMPCAPQKISDWDQAFGLMVGLVMLAVEVGPVIVTWALRGKDEENVSNAAYTLLNEGGDGGETSA